MADEKTAYERLTLKQRLFVDHYLGQANGNATQAARLAGYGCPEKMGYKVLRQSPGVRLALEELLREHAMPAGEVLARLTEQGRGLYAAYIDEEGQVDLRGLRQAGLMRLVKKISRDRNNKVAVEFHDVQAALVQVGRAHGLFRDRHEIEVRDAGALDSLIGKLAGLAARGGAADVPGEPDGGGAAGAAVSVGVLGSG